MESTKKKLHELLEKPLSTASEFTILEANLRALEEENEMIKGEETQITLGERNSNSMMKVTV